MTDPTARVAAIARMGRAIRESLSVRRKPGFRSAPSGPHWSIQISLSVFGEERHQLAGEQFEARTDLIADGEIILTMRHHAKTLGAIDQQDVVGHVGPRLRRRGAADQRCRVDPALAAGALLARIGRTAGGAEGAVKILHMAAGGAGLKGDDLLTLGPIRDSLAHRTRSRNMLT